MRADARLILIVEKEGIFARLAEDHFFETIPGGAILVTGEIARAVGPALAVGGVGGPAVPSPRAMRRSHGGRGLVRSRMDARSDHHRALRSAARDDAASNPRCIATDICNALLSRMRATMLRPTAHDDKSHPTTTGAVLHPHHLRRTTTRTQQRRPPRSSRPNDHGRASSRTNDRNRALSPPLARQGRHARNNEGRNTSLAPATTTVLLSKQ